MQKHKTQEIKSERERETGGNKLSKPNANRIEGWACPCVPGGGKKFRLRRQARTKSRMLRAPRPPVEV